MALTRQKGRGLEISKRIHLFLVRSILYIMIVEKANPSTILHFRNSLAMLQTISVDLNSLQRGPSSAHDPISASQPEATAYRS
jgi:hypothetical protein